VLPPMAVTLVGLDARNGDACDASKRRIAERTRGGRARSPFAACAPHGSDQPVRGVDPLGLLRVPVAHEVGVMQGMRAGRDSAREPD
jgi:hypothetical protein